MAALDAPFLAELPEADRLHFRNLALIRPQLPTVRQLELIEGLARNLTAPRLLTLIARTPHWLVHGPVLEALAENEATPESLRRDMELAVSLFDLMREMERAPEPEKEERAEAIRSTYLQLPPDLKPIVKQQAKALARAVNPTGTTLELPPLPDEDPDWEALTLPPKDRETAPGPFRISKRDLVARAEETHIQEDLRRFLLDEDADVRAAALRNPALGEESLLESLPGCAIPALFEEVYAESRWYFREPLRETLYLAPHCPPAMAKRLACSRDLVAMLERGIKSRRGLHRVASLFTQAEESEYQYLTYWAKRRAPNILRVIKIYYDRLQRRRSVQASGLTAGSGQGEKWISLEERVFMATQATQPEQIIAALKDSDPQVFLVALENPGLTPRELLSVIPFLDAARAERLALSSTWSSYASIREALVHNVHLSEHSALALLRTLPGPARVMLDILRDQRIPHLSVKQQAQEVLRKDYLAMSTAQRVVALRGSGGELLRHLPQEILKDEETLRILIADRQLDPTILLRLARNKQTPRGILEGIAAHPVLLAHPAVMTELLLNPKTPREPAARIWGLLSESEQIQLLRSPHLPVALRQLGAS